MTKHMTGTRDEWLAARIGLAQGGERAHAAQRRARAAAAGLAVGQGRQGLPVRDRCRERLAERPLPRTLAAHRLPLHVRARLQGGLCVRARRSRTASTASSCIWRTTTSRLRRCRARRWRSCSAYKQRMGWTFPWASSAASDFNADFNVSFTEDATARRRHRLQLPARAGDCVARRSRGRRCGGGRSVRGHVRC